MITLYVSSIRYLDLDSHGPILEILAATKSSLSLSGVRLGLLPLGFDLEIRVFEGYVTQPEAKLETGLNAILIKMLVVDVVSLRKLARCLLTGARG